MKGPTSACFADLFQNASKSLLGALVGFVGITEIRSCHRWIQGSMPGGENLLRLRIFLELSGYQVDEFENLDPEVKLCARIIAHRLASVKEVAHATDTTVDTLLKIILGQRKTSNKRKSLIANYCNLRQIPLEEAEKYDKNRISHRLPFSGIDHTDRIQQLAELIQNAIPLAKEILSDQYTASERNQLRDLTSNEGVFTLSNLLSRLCSETARKDL